MDLIPGLILFLGAIAIVFVFGRDTFQNRKEIRILKAQPSSISRQSKQQGLIRTLFNRS